MTDFWETFADELDGAAGGDGGGGAGVKGLPAAAPAPAGGPAPAPAGPPGRLGSGAPGGATGALDAAPSDCDDDTCGECGVPTRRDGHQRVCPTCGRIYEFEGELDQALSSGSNWKQGPARVFAARPSPQFKIVGPERGRFGGLLDSVAPADTAKAQTFEVYTELCNLNNEFLQKYHKAFPKDVLRQVAEVYVSDVIQKAGIIRSQNKRTVLAQLVFSYCVKRCEVWSREEVAQLFQLDGGLARGESQLRKMGACTSELNQDQVFPCIVSAFAGLGLNYDPHARPDCTLSATVKIPLTAADGALIERLRAAALDLVQTGAENYLGIGSAPRTRAVGATYAVLRRAAIAGLLPAHWRLPAVPEPKGRGSLEWVSKGRVEIRPQTVRNYLAILAEYHRVFAPVFERHGLAAEPIAAL